MLNGTLISQNIKTKTELEAHRQRIKELTNAYDEAQENVTIKKRIRYA